MVSLAACGAWVTLVAAGCTPARKSEATSCDLAEIRKQRDDDRAVPLERATACAGPCSRGEKSACVAGAVIESAWKASAARGASELQRLCANDVGAACADQAVEEGAFRADPPQAAIDLARKACALGEAYGCALKARIELRLPDEAKQRDPYQALQAACDAGSWFACLDLVGRADDADDVPSLFALQRGCLAGDGLMCFGAGRGLERVQPLADEAALVWFDAGCKAGSATACHAAGELLLVLGGSLRRARALDTWKRGCDAGHLASCRDRAATIVLGGDAQRGRSKAKAVLEERCEEGDAEACRASGQEKLTRAGKKGVKAPVLEELRRKCSPTAVWACELVAADLLRRPEGERDDRVLRETAEKACEGGSCASLVWALERGIGGSADEGRATALQRKECDTARGHACFGAAESNLFAKEGDPTAAWEDLETACTGGTDEACSTLAWHLRGGTFGTRDPARSRQLERQSARRSGASCDAHPKWGACTLAGRSDIAGFGNERALAHGRARLETACREGEREGCAEAAQAHAGALGGPRDDARATELFERACALDPGQCVKLVRHQLGLRDDAGPAVRARLVAATHLPTDEAATLLAVLSHAGLVPGPRTPLAKLEAACDRGSATGCAAALLVGGYGGLVPPHAERNVTAGCPTSAIACLAQLFVAELSAAPERADALAVDLRATGRDTASDRFGFALATKLTALHPGPRTRHLDALRALHGLGVAASPEVALAGFQRGCREGVLGACARLPSPPPGAAAQALVQCKLAQVGACAIVDRLGVTGAARAEALGAGCDAGIPRACRLVALEADPTGAAALLRDACEGGDGPACAELARRRRDGLPRDGLLGLHDLDAYACEGGVFTSCVRAAEGLSSGPQELTDLPRATDLLVLGCVGGHEPACAPAIERLRREGDQLLVERLSAPSR